MTPLLQSVASTQPVRRPRPANADATRAWVEQNFAALPKRLQNAPRGPYRKTLSAMVEADTRIGKSLGLDREMTARWMAFVWGKPLSVVRDERAAQQHPMPAVELIKDTEHGGYVTPDGRWRVRRGLYEFHGRKHWRVDDTTGTTTSGFATVMWPNLASAKEYIAELLEEAASDDRKRRGHITRQLKDELRKVVSNGDD